jgi:nucleosome binding factor SPN SPT16 subunit
MGFDLEVYGSVLLRESQVTFPHTKTSTHTNTKQVRGEKLDVNYNNIRHSVFQPCKKELTVILHFNLKNPILINKKKHTNVQFYTEVVEKSLALKKSKRSMYDPDEIDEEQRERKLKRKLNELFKKFQLRVNAMLERIGKETIEFDVPYRNLAFQGRCSSVEFERILYQSMSLVSKTHFRCQLIFADSLIEFIQTPTTTGTPHKEMVTMMPCTHCLVNLTDYPHFVLSLDDIDHVHFERASVSVRTSTFEMVVILKDHKKDPIRIDAIPTKKLDVRGVRLIISLKYLKCY